MADGNGFRAPLPALAQGERLAGKVALITGAASGFGAEMAGLFAAHGAKVALLDINTAGAQSVAAGIDGPSLVQACDVTDRDQINAAVAATHGEFGRLDIVVNNAGWSHPNMSLMDVDDATYDRLYAINVKAIYLMTQAVVPVMRAQGSGGAILNIGSTSGIRPRPGLTWYAGSKAAVNLVSKAMAIELAPDGIRVNCVAPVMGATALLETFMGLPDTPENRARFEAGIPLGRLSEPRDVANAALNLVSDEASFLTGIVLEVDGGRCI